LVAAAVVTLASLLTLVTALVGVKHFKAVMVEQVVTKMVTLKPFLVHTTLQSVVAELLESTVDQVQLMEVQQLALV
jgi:hypothetical protein